jgi:hypothetical protein
MITRHVIYDIFEFHAEIVIFVLSFLSVNVLNRLKLVWLKLIALVQPEGLRNILEGVALIQGVFAVELLQKL